MKMKRWDLGFESSDILGSFNIPMYEQYNLSIQYTILVFLSF